MRGFRLAAAWLAIGPMALAVAQQGSASNQPTTPVMGTVKTITGPVISVETGAGVVDVATDAHTEVWKGKIFHDLSPIRIGDDFSARCRTGSTGKLVAEAIWLNIVNFYGVVTTVDGDTFEMLTNPNADPQSAYVRKTLKVSVGADTVFTASGKQDLKSGRDVQMVGLDLKNGTVAATRLTVYEGNRPVRMKGGKAIAPDGTVVDVKDR